MRGLGASPGIAIGHTLRLDERGRHHIYYIEIPSSQLRMEMKRLRDAVNEARSQLREIKHRLEVDLGHPHAYILDAHLLMLEDENVLDELERQIRTRHMNAEWAVRTFADQVKAAYRQVNDPYLRERAADIEDVASRLLQILSGGTTFRLSELDEDVIIVAEDIWPSTIAELDFGKVLGFATDAGGLTSHSAIIARAIGLPTVVGLHDVTRRLRTNDLLVLDGTAGDVILRPTRGVIKTYIKKRKREAERYLYEASKSEPAVTLDGTHIVLRANVELASEIESSTLFGAEGIGLYRSEYLFLKRLPALPTEDEQYQVYCKLARASGEAGANIRVFDLGGDKLTLEGFEKEQNPVLGLRGIRLSLKVEEIFRTQVRAILRANQFGHLRIVLPLVSMISELREAKRIIAEVKSQMAEAGIEHRASLPVGVMIEVPAVALLADLFAREADFLSIGTNDLTQYLLAVDRTNENVASLYQPLHPVVLHTIVGLVSAAERAHVPIEVCGEMASNPMHALALAGLGIRAFSLVPAAIPFVKNAFRAIDLDSLTAIMQEALSLSSGDEVEKLLSKEIPRQSTYIQAALSTGL